MTKDSVLKKRQTLGFDVEEVPYIPGKVEDALVIEDGEPIRWFYLIPKKELSKEYEKEMNELVERIGDE